MDSIKPPGIRGLCLFLQDLLNNGFHFGRGDLILGLGLIGEEFLHPRGEGAASNSASCLIAVNPELTGAGLMASNTVSGNLYGLAVAKTTHGRWSPVTCWYWRATNEPTAVCGSIR